MSKSIKTNYILNSIRTITSMLFPLITFPYVARILMADGIGQINFFSSIISYISLFTCLGIPIYAIRETAKVRDNIKELNKVTVEILILHFILTILGYIIVFIIAYNVPEIKTDIPLFLLLSLTIFFTFIGAEWFYTGLEDFKYITVRAILVKTVCVILLFILVKSKNDLIYYALYTVLVTVGNNCFNFVRLRKYIKPEFIIIKDLKPFRHIKPVIRIFALNIVISIYVNLDKVMLGFISSNAAVGYYTGATKITGLLMSIVSSLQTVMIPRCSYLIGEGNMEKFHNLIQKVVDYVIAVTIPISVATFIMAPFFIRLFCGASYEPSILTLRIVSPIIFLIAMSGIPCFQILYPQGKEKYAIASTATGATVNFILNIFLIPLFAENGAALATVIAETTVTFTMYYFGRKYIMVKKWDKHYGNCLFAAFVMAMVLCVISLLKLSDLANLIIMILLAIITYMLILYLFKDNFVLSLTSLVKKRLRI